MNLVMNNLIIRDAASYDAELLCRWWNDGVIMTHAGFPDGINTTAEKIRNSLTADTNDTHRRHIIEYNGAPIGEMNYRNKGEGVAEIGIKICDFTQQEKGLGTTLLSMFIEALFNERGYEKIILDTNIKNKRAQHVYEKLGFNIVGIREQAWRDQSGEMQSAVDYVLAKEEWNSRK